MSQVVDHHHRRRGRTERARDRLQAHGLGLTGSRHLDGAHLLTRRRHQRHPHGVQERGRRVEHSRVDARDRPPTGEPRFKPVEGGRAAGTRRTDHDFAVFLLAALSLSRGWRARLH